MFLDTTSYFRTLSFSTKTSCGYLHKTGAFIILSNRGKGWLNPSSHWGLAVKEYSETTWKFSQWCDNWYVAYILVNNPPLMLLSDFKSISGYKKRHWNRLVGKRKIPVEERESEWRLWVSQNSPDSVYIVK